MKIRSWSYEPGDLIIHINQDTVYRWWWRDWFTFGVNFSCGFHLYLGPFGHIGYWP